MPIIFEALQVKGLEEAAIATIVGGLILIINSVTPDWNWYQDKYKNLWRLLLCEAVPFGAYFTECFSNADVPLLDPVCGAQGIINSAIAGVLAYLMNEYSERALREQIIPRLKKYRAQLAGTWVYIFLFTVLLEVVLLFLGVNPWIGMLISILATVITTVLGVLISPLAVFRASWEVRQLVWAFTTVLKVVIHFLPLPFWLKPLISAGLTVVVFIVTNFIM